MKKLIIIICIVIGIASGLAAGKSIGPRYKLETIKVGWKMNAQKITIKSLAFKNMEYLPAKFTRDGQGINPELLFENIPAAAKSLALIMDDPDAPYGTFDHWLLFNISPKTKEIKEGSVPAGAIKGKNTAGTLSYVSPSPPPGKPHRYVFKLYALDSLLSLKDGADKAQIEKAMAGHIISQASLTGLYKR